MGCYTYDANVEAEPDADGALDLILATAMELYPREAVGRHVQFVSY